MNTDPAAPPVDRHRVLIDAALARSVGRGRLTQEAAERIAHDLTERTRDMGVRDLLDAYCEAVREARGP